MRHLMDANTEAQRGFNSHNHTQAHIHSPAPERPDPERVQACATPEECPFSRAWLTTSAHLLSPLLVVLLKWLKTKGLGSEGRACLPFPSTLGRVPRAGLC